MMKERIKTDDSAYDYVIKGKEPPLEVIEATNARQQELKTFLAKLQELKTPHEQYLECIKKRVYFKWPKDDAPAEKRGQEMEGGVPVKKEP